MPQKEHYIVSARKYRPSTFQTVVGQRALTATLKNAIRDGKLAQAYLFSGPRGVGKTSCARIFAKTINCMNPTPDGEACGVCESCQAIEKGNSFNLVELDAASNNSVDDIRSITDQVNIPAQNGRYRVFIIDEVHMLSNNAFNAFLKTLEEPPKNVVFILATTERHKVIPTILSRCQVYDFRRITVDDIIDHLEDVANREGIKTEREALGEIALKADGGMRDALSIFDQVTAATGGNITYQGVIDALNVLDAEYYFRMMENFRQGDVASALLSFKEITDKGFDAQYYINGLAAHIRNLMVCADPRTVSLLETSEERSKKYLAQAPLFPVEWYYTAMKILNDADYNYRTSSNKRLLVELALIRLSRLLNQGNSVPNSPVEGTGVPFVKPVGEKPQTAPAKKQEEIKKEDKKAEEPKPAEREQLKEPEEKYRRKSGVQRPTSFRLSNESVTKTSKTDEGPRRQSFTEETFKKAWDGYIAAHPEQRILAGAMRGMLPEKTGDFSYKFIVDHPAQRQAFETAQGELLEYLKSQLENDLVTVSVEVVSKDGADRGMNPKEFLQHVVNDNPSIAKFLKDIDAELI